MSASAQKVIVRLKHGSDGDPTHRPTGPTYTRVDPPTFYLEKIAQQWMRARGEEQSGISYILEQLPAGYALYQRPRPSNPKIIDKFLYGHPNHKPFDSPNRFFPHFQYLMDNGGSSIGCPCSVCYKGGILPKLEGSRSSFFSDRTSPHNNSSGAKSGRLTPKLAPVPTPASVPPLQRGRPKMVGVGMDTSRVDEEGTPDVYRNLIDKLKRYGTIDEPIVEHMSLDWRAEQSILPALLSKLKEDAQWCPRAGDIVLYLRNLPDGLELLQHVSTGEHRLWDSDTETFMDAPAWEAGLVGQTPVEKVTLNDAIQQGETELNVSLSGVRVEPLPNPNSSNKSLSKRYKYVPVHQTRPFFLWYDYLGYIPSKDWHPTIKNALTAMSTMSLVGKYRFRGQWPDAQIYCNGIYMGSEMIIVGDTVRLLPKAPESSCTDVLVVKSIRIKLSNLDKASSNDYDEGRPYNSEVWIFGSAYTTEALRSSKQWIDAENTDCPKAAEGYSTWYPLHPPNKELAVPFPRILGRLYEHDAMNLWLSSDLDQGREGVVEARVFAKENDKRIDPSSGSTWFWGDSRSEALDLETVNGLDVGKFDAERNPQEWRKQIKVMDSAETAKSAGTQMPAATTKSRLRAFMAPETLPMRAGEGRTRTKDHSAPFGTSVSSKSGHQNVPGANEYETEEEIRHKTVFIEEDQPTISQRRKAKVMVVVD